MTAAILACRSAARFWFAVIVTGAGTGLAAAALTGLLELVQRFAWGGGGLDLLSAAAGAAPWRHVAVLGCAGGLVGIGQIS